LIKYFTKWSILAKAPERFKICFNRWLVCCSFEYFISRKLRGIKNDLADVASGYTNEEFKDFRLLGMYWQIDSERQKKRSSYNSSMNY